MDTPLVAAVEAAAYTLSADRPEADGTLAWDSTTVVVVHASGGGCTGLGWSYGPSWCAQAVREHLAPVVVGRPVLAVPASYAAMVDAVRNLTRPGAASIAISAVDTALWDLKSRVVGLPLHDLLGAVRDSVPVYGSGGFTTYDEGTLRRQLEAWVSQGIGSAKIKIGESWGRAEARDLERVRQARDTIGPGVELFVDANGGYTTKQAIRVGRALADLGVSWFEEPVSSDDLAGLREVREHLSIDVTAGEYGHDLPYFARMCAAGAVDCLQVDVTRCGGITEWQRICSVAAANHLDVSAHCAPALHAAVALATPRLRHVELFHDHARIEQLLFDNVPDLVAGELVCGSEPGNGMGLRKDRAAEYRVA